MTTILIVDDHPPMRLALRVQLSAMSGVETVLEADNGPAAVESVRLFTPDLIVLDLDIPCMTGLEVVPRMLALQPGARILIMSAQDPDQFAARAWNAGALGYCSKSQDLHNFVRCVQSVLNGYTIFPIGGRQPAPAIELVHEEVVDDQLDKLSDKEVTVLRMLARGMTNKAIGAELFISNKTVSSYKTRIMVKLRARTFLDLVDFARQRGLAP